MVLGIVQQDAHACMSLQGDARFQCLLYGLSYTAFQTNDPIVCERYQQEFIPSEKQVLQAHAQADVEDYYYDDNDYNYDHEHNLEREKEEMMSGCFLLLALMQKDEELCRKAMNNSDDRDICYALIGKPELCTNTVDPCGKSWDKNLAFTIPIKPITTLQHFMCYDDESHQFQSILSAWKHTFYPYFADRCASKD